ncbi:MAG: DNA mismatch endonuclease Vsr [Deltaproteobacteria bacterium]|nr:DNA mismatch endonuclease Vsr [Deltaproteobacteria bacterium]
MADILDRASRSRLMSGIRSKNTRIEISLRRGLHARGFRYRLHDPKIPGRPDLAFPKYGATVFINGCFWHGHDCELYRLPKTRTEFWRKNIETNVQRDHRVKTELAKLGWRQFVIWECSIRGTGRRDFDAVIDNVAAWLRSVRHFGQIRGRRT